MRIIGDMKMPLTKPEFVDLMKEWMERYLRKTYSGEYDIEVIVPSSNISKLQIEAIKKVENYSSFEFSPDILGVLRNKKTKEIKLAFMNRSISAISLKEIGELHCYSKLANPIFSCIVSPKGLPNEVNLLLLNKDIELKLLKYSENKFINIFRWDETTNNVDKKSIFPLDELTEFEI